MLPAALAAAKAWLIVPPAESSVAPAPWTKAIGALAVTLRSVEPVVEPEVAVMVVEPAAIPVASPLLPAVLLIVATPVADELQVTDVVRFCVLPSLNVPVAVNCCVPETTIVGFAGVTASDESVGTGVTVTLAVAVPPSVAVSVTPWDAATDPPVAVNVVELVVAGTSTEAGTGSAALFEASPTVLPPAGAG